METYGNLAESDDVVGHSQDSGLENCGFAEEKVGAGEGNRTLVSVHIRNIIVLLGIVAFLTLHDDLARCNFL